MSTKKGIALTLTVIVLFGLALLVGAGIKCLIDGFEGLDNGYNPEWSQYGCDPRIGCDTNLITQREATNIEQERLRYGMSNSLYTNPNQESFDMDNWRPGVDFPVDPRVETNNIIRTEGMNGNNTGRDKMNFVLQQFGNDGTVINPSSNPLMNPAPPTLM